MPEREASTPSAPSEQALSIVGHAITWTDQRGTREHKSSGMCIGVRRMPGRSMQTEDGLFPCIQFQIELLSGKKVWTGAFADKGPALGNFDD